MRSNNYDPQDAPDAASLLESDEFYAPQIGLTASNVDQYKSI